MLLMVGMAGVKVQIKLFLICRFEFSITSHVKSTALPPQLYTKKKSGTNFEVLYSNVFFNNVTDIRSRYSSVIQISRYQLSIMHI